MLNKPLTIDGGVFLDRNPSTGLDFSPRVLLELMDINGVDMALCATHQALYYDVNEGNQKTLDLCAKNPERLIPMAITSAMSYHADQGKMKQIKSQGFAMVALLPSLQSFRADNYCIKKIAEEAFAEGLPIQISLSSTEELGAIVRLLADQKGPIFLRWIKSAGYQHIAQQIAIAQDYPQFYFDVGQLTTLGGIQQFAEIVGSQRLFFSTNIPNSCEHSTALLLESSELKGEEREAIYGKNLLQALKLTPFHRSKKMTVNNWLTRPKVDTHWHTDHWNLTEPRTDAKSLSADLDLFGIHLAVFSAIRSLNGDIRRGNHEMTQWLDQEKRARGLIVIDPLQVQSSLEQMEQYAPDLRFVAIKTIPDFYGVHIDDERYKPMLEKAVELGLTLMTHKEGVDTVAENFPKLRIVAAHCLGEDVQKLWPYENIHFDIATSHIQKIDVNLEKILSISGGDRILFSSDGPLISPAWTLGKLMGERASEKILQKIFVDNAGIAFPRLQESIELIKELS